MEDQTKTDVMEYFNVVNVDHVTVDNWEPMLRVRKKPIIVHATQLNYPFEVTTLSGLALRGETGDYLIIGTSGEKYPCKREIFEKTYDIFKDEI